jgi:hypothetical protein
MTKKVIVAGEKGGLLVYDADNIEAASELIIRDRNEGGYYTDAEIAQARKAIEAGRAYAFLQSRRHFEYEDFYLLDVLRA